MDVDTATTAPTARVVAISSARTVATPTLLRRALTHRFVLAGVAAVVTGAVSSINAFGYPRLKEDEGHATAEAFGILHGGGHAALYASGHLPGVPLVLAGWVRALGLAGGPVSGLDHLTAIQQGRSLLVLLTAIQAGLIFVVVRRLTANDIVAGSAVALWALSPFQLWYGRWLEPDPFAAFWTVVALVLALPSERGRWWVARAAAAGLCVGAAIFSKEIAVVAVPGFLVMMFAWPAGRRVVATATMLLGALFLPVGFVAWTMAQHEFFTGADPSFLHYVQQEKQVAGHDGGILNPHSQFWSVYNGWYGLQPFFIVAATLACLWLAGFASTRARRAVGIMGAGYVVLFASGLLVQEYYVAAALPVWIIGLVVAVADLLPLLGSRGVAAGGSRRRLGVPVAVIAAVLLLPSISADVRGFTVTDASQETQLALFARSAVPAAAAFIDDGFDTVDLESTSLPGHPVPLSCNYYDIWCANNARDVYILDDGLLRYLVQQDPRGYAPLTALIARGSVVWSTTLSTGDTLRLYHVQRSALLPA